MKYITYDEFLNLVQTFVKHNDWAGLESYFNQYCAHFISDKIAADIQKVDLADCGVYLRNKALEALKLGKAYNVSAIYYEYNMWNDWASQFYICPDYNPVGANDDGWVQMFIPLKGELEGYEPSADNNSFEFSKALFDCKNIEERTAAEYYLAARTTAVFGRAIEEIDFGNIALCCGFQGQQSVTRIYEPLNVKVEG